MPIHTKNTDIYNSMKEYLSKTRRRNAEEGLTLVEILVAVSLLAIVSVMVVSLINTTMNSASRFSNVTTTQGQVSNGLNQIQRDLSAASKIVAASDNAVTVLTREGGKDVQVTYFAYQQGNAASIPAGITLTSTPTFNALIQARQTVRADGSLSPSATSIVVKGIILNGFSDPSKDHTFDYYDRTNALVPVAETTSGSSTSNVTAESINRVEFRIAAMAEGRGTPIQLESSATVNSSKTQASVGSEFYSGVPECPTNIAVTIDPSGNTNPATTAILNWYSPIGATSYTIYMTNVRTNATDTVLITDPTVLTYRWDDLNWGDTYSWGIQANGPGGTTGLCGPAQGTIIPATINFVNINSLAALTSTNPNGASTVDNITRAAETAIPAKTVTTANNGQGLRYTVARGLTNQLSWNTTNGVVGYRIYDPTNMTAPLATITASGTQYGQLPANYGDVRTYVVRAYNAGGESFTSNTITLVSPPRASAATAADPDTSVRSTTTDSVVTIATKQANTDGFRTYKSEGFGASTQNYCNPTTWNAAPTLNFATTDGTKTDNNAAWGSNSCYRLVPFNDAGPGVASTASVLHRPGKFAITQAFNTSTMRVIDTGRDLNGGGGGLSLPWCWTDPYGRVIANDMNCSGGYGHNYSAYYPIGMFGTADNTPTNIALRWNESSGAYKDYSVVRTRLATSQARVDQTPATSITTAAAYVSGGQGINYNNEMPGSVYRFAITATGQNDLTRQRVTEMVTKPDIPHHMQGIYYVKNLGGYNGTRINLNVHVSAIRGLADSIRVSTLMAGQGWKYETKAISNAYETFSSNYQTTPGSNYRYATTILTRTVNEAIPGVQASGATQRSATYTVESDSIGRVGTLVGFVCPPGPGSCNDPNGKSQVASGYPAWWTGAPSRYWSGGSANNGSQVVSSNAAVQVPDGPQLSNEEDNSSLCVQTSEDDPQFTANCAYGTGVPPAPQVNVVQSGATTQNFSWSSWPGITDYKVTYTVNGTTTTVTKTATDRSLSLNVPVGTRATVSVIPSNPTNEGPAGTGSAETAPAIPTNVQGTVTGNNINVTWNAVSGATGYTVTYTRGGTDNSVNVTGTSASLTGLAEGSYSIRVSSSAGGIQSAPSAVLIREIFPSTPSVISSVDIYKGTGTTWNVDFTHNGGTVIYNYTVTGPNGYNFASNDYTTSSAAGTIVQYFYFTAAANGNYTVKINAYNQAGVQSSYTRIVNVQATMTNPGAPTALTPSTVSNRLSATYKSGTSATKTEVEIINRANNTVVNQQTITETTAGATKTITTTLPSGSYTVKVRSVSANGTTSAWVTSQYSF